MLGSLPRLIHLKNKSHPSWK